MPRTVRVGEIADVFTGAPTHGRSHLGRGTVDVQVLSVQDVQTQGLGAGRATTTDDQRVIARYKVGPGDVVVTARGAPRAAVVAADTPLYIDANLIGVRPYEYPAHLLAAYVNSPRGEAQLRRLSTSTTGLYAISASKLATVEVPSLSPGRLRAMQDLLEQRERWLKANERAVEAREQIVAHLLNQTMEETK